MHKSAKLIVRVWTGKGLLAIHRERGSHSGGMLLGSRHLTHSSAFHCILDLLQHIRTLTEGAPKDLQAPARAVALLQNGVVDVELQPLPDQRLLQSEVGVLHQVLLVVHCEIL